MTLVRMTLKLMVGGKKNRGEVQKQKFEGSESDSDADRARRHKKELINEGRQMHDSSEGDSDSDEQEVIEKKWLRKVVIGTTPVRTTLILMVRGKRREVKFKRKD
uniref:Uncharacterized protein n=1 Tax=Gossypium raimondii TaxID=29730 RepID=A0A0D2VD60_GOSRA|nr:hypothetical protein B456_010G210600 [Gossypium raimondii]